MRKKPTVEKRTSFVQCISRVMGVAGCILTLLRCGMYSVTRSYEVMVANRDVDTQGLIRGRRGAETPAASRRALARKVRYYQGRKR